MSAALRVVEAHAEHYRHTWHGSAVTTFLTPVLYLLAMGVGLGTLVDRGAPQLPGGLTYLEFVAPALLAAAAMQVAASESTFPVMSGIRWEKTYHAVLATPVRPRDIVAGNLGWTAVRLALSAVVYAVVLAAFGVTSLPAAALAVLPAVLTGLAFAAPITAWVATLERDSSLAGLYRFGIVPLFLFSGTFFPVSELPDVLEPVAYVTPLWHGVELCRAAALGLPAALPVPVHIAYLAAWFVAGAAVARRTLHRRLIV